MLNTLIRPSVAMQLTQLVVIDPGVTDYQTLLSGVIEGSAVLVLDSTKDGIEQITTALQKFEQAPVLHLVTHGSPGCLSLGKSHLSLETLESHAPQIQSWQLASLVVYGCRVAAEASGMQFLARLQQIIKADIAASTTPTGSCDLGGDWQFNVLLGGTVPALAFTANTLKTYRGIFPIVLDGVNDFVDVPNESQFDLTGAMTIEARIKVSSFTKGWQAIINKGDSAWRIQRNANTNGIEFWL
jgi:hypothetical protein